MNSGDVGESLPAGWTGLQRERLADRAFVELALPGLALPGLALPGLALPGLALADVTFVELAFAAVALLELVFAGLAPVVCLGLSEATYARLIAKYLPSSAV